MLNLKKSIYINTGLQDRSKCSYYWAGKEMYIVYIDSRNDKNQGSVVYGIKFKDAESAKYFADNYIIYDKCYFDVFTYNNEVIIEPIRVDGVLKINCGENEQIAKKLVIRFRTQNLDRLYRNKQTKKSAKQDFQGIMF